MRLKKTWNPVNASVFQKANYFLSIHVTNIIILFFIIDIICDFSNKFRQRPTDNIFVFR